jgi:hypothetical protein
MANAYYSTVFTQSADEIRPVIRDFNSYPVWVDGSGESKIEDDKSSDAFGWNRCGAISTAGPNRPGNPADQINCRWHGSDAVFARQFRGACLLPGSFVWSHPALFVCCGEAKASAITLQIQRKFMPGRSG